MEELDETTLENSPEAQEILAKIKQVGINVQKIGERIDEHRKEGQDMIADMRRVMHEAAVEIQKATADLEHADQEAAEALDKIDTEHSQDMDVSDAEDVADEKKEEIQE